MYTLPSLPTKAATAAYWHEITRIHSQSAWNASYKCIHHHSYYNFLTLSLSISLTHTAKERERGNRSSRRKQLTTNAVNIERGVCENRDSNPSPRISLSWWQAPPTGNKKVTSPLTETIDYLTGKLNHLKMCSASSYANIKNHIINYNQPARLSEEYKVLQHAVWSYLWTAAGAFFASIWRFHYIILLYYRLFILFLKPLNCSHYSDAPCSSLIILLLVLFTLFLSSSHCSHFFTIPCTAYIVLVLFVLSHIVLSGLCSAIILFVVLFSIILLLLDLLIRLLFGVLCNIILSIFVFVCLLWLLMVIFTSNKIY